MKFVILGVPFSKQSFRVTNRGHKYQSKKVIDAENNVKAQLIQQLPSHFKPFSKAVVIKDVSYVFPPLKSFSKKLLKAIDDGEIIYKTTKPDMIDNLFKGLGDAMNGIIMVDDALICRVDGYMRKIYGRIPMIEFEVYEVEDAI